MNETPIDPAEATPAAESTVESPQPATDEAAEPALADEMRRLGEQIGAAIRAAVNTPEAKGLRGEVEDGARALRGEIDAAIGGAKVPKVSRPERPKAPTGQIKNELAGALRSANRALARLAASMAPEEADETGEAPAEAAADESAESAPPG